MANPELVSAPRVCDVPPEPTDWGMVVRPIFGGVPPFLDPYIQKRFDLDGSPTEIYIGYADRCAGGPADPIWTIKRIELVNSSPTTSQWSPPNSIWANRAALVYC